MTGARRFLAFRQARHTRQHGVGRDIAAHVNWGIFETRGWKPYRFLMIDTHFANRDDEDEEARRGSAALIAARLPALAHGLRIVLTGDFNATPDSEAHRRLSASLTDVWATSPGPSGTFHDFTGLPGTTIDYIMVRGFAPIMAEVMTTHRDDHYPSDHFQDRRGAAAGQLMSALAR